MRCVRIWLLYLAAWLPYTASYFLLFQFGQPPHHALAKALCNVVPAAVLGLAVISFTSRYSWQRHGERYFLPLHLIAALLYSLLWWGAIRLDEFCFFGLADGQWTFGDWGSYAGQWQIFSGFMIYGNIAGFCYVLEVQRRYAEEERLRAQAELHALRSQLNPHFLFNTLHSVVALVNSSPAKAERALLQLSDMLRYTLRSQTQTVDDEVTLREEIEFARQYLAIESLRLGERLTVEWHVDPAALGFLLPALTLQPLLENAIRHGIAPLPAGGKIILTADCSADELQLCVADTGAGSRAVPHSQGGLGLQTVQRRLQFFSAGRADVQIESQPGHGF